jgi:putative ABC transport system permease protein
MILLRRILAPLLLIYQSSFLAMGQVWVNKVRSLLTMLGIIIGVASVTSVIAALTGLKHTVLAQFESYGTNRIFIMPAEPKDGHHYHWADLRFYARDFDGLLEHCPSVAAMTRVCENDRTVSFGAHARKNVNVRGIEASWHTVSNRRVILGRPFSLIDNSQPRAVCLINDKTRSTFGLDADPSGQALVIDNRRFTVVGVVASRTDTPMFDNGNGGLEVFIPFKIAYSPDHGTVCDVISRSPDLSVEARAEVHAFLRHKRHLGFSKPDNFRLEAVQKYLDDFQTVFTMVTAVTAGIVAISLLVGGVGIMNIMLVSVSERTREIGLRKAVGARPSVILLQFLVEALVLCLLGGILGLAAGEGITMVLKILPAAHLDQASIPGWAIALSFGFAAAVGLIFGMFPAIRAARLDPIEALRHE